jgi:general secretion pathway protein E
MTQFSFQQTRVALAELKPGDANFSIDAVNLLLAAALESGASDLHLQPRADGWEILLRVDGVLAEVGSLPHGESNDPVTRLMVLARLPTYRSSQPMEGRLRWEEAPADISMRVGVFPSVHGSRAVVRLLRRNSVLDQLNSLGLPEDVVQTLVHCSDQTDGAILLSGPSGSGKTTTLYAVLRKIASVRPRRSVITIEDPVESLIHSISQSELDDSGGMTLASALRSAMRQDSEVLLVSEIRDPETAEAAMQASLTGHLVFSSLHATDVAAALRRLTQLGIPMHAARSGLRAIVSQRLLRRTCTDCGGQARGEGADSCQVCLGTGYKGRIPLAQAVRFDGGDAVGEALADTLESGQPLSVMRRAARDAGGIDLAARAQHYINSGSTTAAEVYRVLGQIIPDS